MPEPSRNRRILFCAAIAVAGALAVAPAFGYTAVVKLTGTEEVPPVDSDAFGECLVTLDEVQAELNVKCTHTADDPVAWHIHNAPAGVAGPILLNPGGTGESPFETTFPIGPATVGLLLTEQLYINVHTTAHATGEIRGQIQIRHDLNEIATTFPLDGDQETPPIESDLGGTCHASVNPDTATLLLACVHDVEDAVAAHIHVGERGVPGPIEIDLGDPASPILRTIELEPDQVDAFTSGTWYVNVHSPANAAGEVRGQIDGCFESTETLCLEDGRFQVEVTFTDFEEQDHVGQSVRETTNSGMFWFIEPSNLEMLVKVLNACTFNDRYWVFLAATTDVGFELTVTDTATGTVKTYSNTLGSAAVAVTDTDAFDTCSG
jgi:hypothetical protein